MGAVHVGNEVEVQLWVAILQQRTHCHVGAKVRAADADIDHVFDAQAVIAFPLAAAYRFREQFDLLAGAGDFRHHVLAVHIHRFIAKMA